jgi:hypothetical protein
MNRAESANSRQIQFATSYLFDFGMYLPKLSMLAFYFQLFPVHEVLLRRALYVITVFVVLSAVASLTLRTFWCGLRPWENWYVANPLFSLAAAGARSLTRAQHYLQVNRPQELLDIPVVYHITNQLGILFRQ